MTSVPPPPRRAARSRHAAVRLSDRMLVVVLGALAAFGPMAVDMYLPSLPAIAADLGAEIGRAQLTLSAFFVGFCLGMLFYGPLSDRFGRRPFLIGGIALFIVASAICALAQTIDQLVAMRFLHAIGGGAASVLARTIVRDIYEPDEVARMLSLLAMVMLLAPLLAPTIGAQILVWLGWRAIFAALTAFGVACLIAVLIGLPETYGPERRGSASLAEAVFAYGRILIDRRAVGLLLCSGMSTAGMFAYLTATPFVYISHFGVSAQGYALLFGLNVIAIMIAANANGRLVRRVGIGRMLWWGSILHAAAGVAVAVTATTGFGGLAGIVVTLFFVIGSVGLIGANCMAALMGRFPANAGAAAALLGAGQFGLGALASVTVSAVHDGTPTAMGIIIGLAGLGALAGRAIAADAGASRR